MPEDPKKMDASQMPSHRARLKLPFRRFILSKQKESDQSKKTTDLLKVTKIGTRRLQKTVALMRRNLIFAVKYKEK